MELAALRRPQRLYGAYGLDRAYRRNRGDGSYWLNRGNRSYRLDGSYRLNRGNGLYRLNRGNRPYRLDR
jgi:hypothetical protein